MIKIILLITKRLFKETPTLEFSKGWLPPITEGKEERDGKIELSEVTGMIQFRGRNEFVKL